MITVLNANGQTVAHFVNNVSEGVPYFEPTLTENIETLVSTFSFSVPLDCDESQYLKGLNKVLVKDKDGDLRQFNIIHTEEVFQEVDSRILVECEDFSISEMNDTVIYPFNGHNLGDTLTKAVQGTGWSVEYSADTWQEVEEPFILADYTNMREVFGNIQKTYDVDFKFTAERTAFNQTKRIVKVYKNRGLQTGRYFTYDRDVLGITRDVRYDTIKTAILPYYTGVEGKVWTLKGMVPVNPIEGITKDKESPLVVHNQAHADYDEPFFFKAMPFKASSTNPEQVYRQGVEELMKYIAPVYTYTVNVILLNRVQGWEGETLALGDTVWMKERVGSREIGLEARVIEYVYHEDDPSLDEVTFTNFREIDTYDTSDIAGIRDALNDLKDQVDSNTVIIETTREQISKLEEGQSGIIEDLGNKNSISIGDTPKPNPIDGDTWFSTRVNEAGQTIHEIKVWDGVEKVWKLSMDTSKAFEAEDTAKVAQKDAEESLVKANQAVEDADTAKTAAQEALDRYNKLMISGRNLALNSQKITIPDTDGAASINRRKSIPLSIKLKPNTQYLLRFRYELESGTLPESITVVLWHGSGFASNIVHVPTKASNVGEGSATLTTNSSEANVLFMYQGKRLEVKQGDSFLFTEVYLVEGDKIGDWQPAPEDAIASITNINGEITSLVTKTDGLETSYSQISQTVDEIQLTVGDKADKSQITQLQDQINLRVEKDDVINQINVSTEGIIIDGAKVQITGKTYIEDAVITDAMISDLSATKLTAGVIDASKINVTNIDASQIKAGTIQGIDIIGSKITNPFEIGSEGYTLTGQTVMERAQVKIDYSVSETGQKGWSILHARGIQNQLLNQDGTINSFSSLASDGLSIQDSQGNRGYLSAELLMQFSNTGKKIYPGNSWVTNTDRITPSLTMDKCAIGWLFLWQPYDTTGGQPYTWDYTYYLVPKAHAIFNNGKGIIMRLQGAGSGGGANNIIYKYVYVSNDSITGTANNGTGNGARWVLTGVFSV
ncbi:phage tail spike protein [Parabacteroides distasonis]|uniref:phage tail spike protein n=1 Tax=Parabacteroides distasonis TaxID=823 RepID=UPI003F29EB86